MDLRSVVLCAVELAHKMTSDIVLARDQAESALRETDALYRTLNEHSIVSIANTAGRIIGINGSCRISGYSREELLGEDHKVLNSGRHPKTFWVEMRRTIASGKSWCGEVCICAKTARSTGSTASSHHSRVRMERSKSTFRSATTLPNSKRNEQVLVRLNMVQEQVGRVAHVGGWEFDPSTGLATWTAEMYEIFEVPLTYTPELASSLACFPGDAGETVAKLVKRAAETGEEFDYTLPFVTAKGNKLWVRGLGKTELRPDGTYRSTAAPDVTES